VRDSLLNDPAMESVASEWLRLTMALVGIGGLPPSRFSRPAADTGTAAELLRL
jgi:DNA-binding transcriptional regulator LsrR (DeoR family)